MIIKRKCNKKSFWRWWWGPLGKGKASKNASRSQ